MKMDVWKCADEQSVKPIGPNQIRICRMEFFGPAIWRKFPMAWFICQDESEIKSTLPVEKFCPKRLSRSYPHIRTCVNAWLLGYPVQMQNGAKRLSLASRPGRK